MKILFVTRPIVPPWDEGTKNVVFDLARHMPEHEIHLLTTKDFPCEAENIVLEKVLTRSGLVSGISLGQKLRVFLRLMKRDDIDIFHFFLVPTFLVALAAKIILKFNKKKTVQTVVSVPREGKKLRKSIFADKVVVGSKFMQKRLAEENIQAERISFGVNVSELDGAGQTSDAKKQFGLEGTSAILFAGNLHPGRGIEVVADSVSGVVKQFPSAKFIFACRFFETGLEQQNLERIKSKMEDEKLKDNVMFLDRIDNMKQLIAACDIVVFPPGTMIYKMDYPLILLEAMAMAKPVVFSDVAPLDELFESNSNIMIEKNSPKQLADSVISLLSDKKKMRLMGENAKALIKERFDIGPLSHKYMDLYEELLKS